MPKPEKPKNETDQYKQFLKYSATAFQMIAIILLSVFMGTKIDDYWATGNSYATLAMTLIGVMVSMFVTIRGLMKP